MKKFLVIAFALIASLSMVSCGQKKSSGDNSLADLKKRGVFVLGLDDAFPPMGFRDGDEIVGYDIDLAKAVAKELGVEFRAQPINWDSKEQELNTGNIDCIWNGLTITDDRKASLSFTQPYLANKQIVVVKNDSGINSIADMKGRKIAIQAGSSAEDAVNDSPDFKASLKEIVPFPENLNALNDLAIGGVDGVVMDSVVAEYAIKMGNYPFKILSESLAQEEYGVAFRKNDVKLVEEVQRILEKLASDGKVAEISEKWFGTDISVIGK